MRPLRKRRIRAILGGRAWRVAEQGDIDGRGLDEHRRCKIPCVAGMPCRVFGRLVSETEARAQLVGVDILTIDAHKPADFGGFVADSLWRSIVGAIADTA
jgi:hypothetical protein